MSDNLHPVRRVRVGELSADIDEELAPIIEAIWRLGWTTWTCCQNAGESNAGWPEKLPHMASVVAAQRGWAYIDFPVDDGLAFLTALAQAGPRDAFYLRMTHWAAPDSWHVNARPMDAAMFDSLRESRFALRLLLIRFPAYDGPEILRRLTAYAAGELIPPAPVDRSSMEPPQA
ncbi:hypothetical protein Aab01nite_52810 [Paractinoplanes abujensis]|uniref:Uncharacterized protein n=1 Tax=Paractinoplanes abujensis TaxID=882441 RepID=A0A7W7CVB9_9ACTN|nr:hypothetical protein [Actinoplanes abujensis]MBB4693651.1 hypothetical protein [Actinoplanes abujensis]GID21691.1 hypothetical protein Aab01nite_52810 [Actinoplanes abujensis]